MTRAYVYFAKNPLTDRVKIGHTENWKARHSSLKSGAGTDLTLLRLIDGGQATERWLHRKFAPNRMHGEWFTFNDEMLSIMPPDEIPVVPRVTVTRDIHLTVKERVAEVRKTIGGLGLGAKHQLLTLAGRLSDDEAELILRRLTGESA